MICPAGLLDASSVVVCGPGKGGWGCTLLWSTVQLQGNAGVTFCGEETEVWQVPLGPCSEGGRTHHVWAWALCAGNLSVGDWVVMETGGQGSIELLLG